MSKYQIILVLAGVALALIIILAELYYHRRAQRSPEKMRARWHLVGEKCIETNTWRDAIIEADKLLDDVLKKRGFKGGSMGERLMSARKKLSDNDAVWFSHKLRDKLVHDGDGINLTKSIVKKALRGTRQALKDLGELW